MAAPMRNRSRAGASIGSSPTRPGARPTTPRSCGRPAGSSRRAASRSRSSRRTSCPRRTTRTRSRPFLFVMCERIRVVEKLAAWESRRSRASSTGRRGIRNTDRERMIALFRARPACRIRRASSSRPSRRAERRVTGAVLGQARRRPCHAGGRRRPSPATPAALPRHLAALAARGHRARGLQDHVAGDLIKFYGVAGLSRATAGPPSWFQWFYHRDQKLANHAFDPGRARRGDARRPRPRWGSRSTAATRSCRRRRHLGHRLERVAELRALPRRWRARPASPRSSRGAVRRSEHRDDEGARTRDEAGPRSKTIVALEQRAHGAGAPVLRALLRPGDGAGPGQPHLSTRTATPTSTSSRASPSAASATAIRTT